MGSRAVIRQDTTGKQALGSQDPSSVKIGQHWRPGLPARACSPASSFRGRSATTAHRPRASGVARARVCRSRVAGVGREGGRVGGQCWRQETEPRVSGGLYSPCHLGTEADRRCVGSRSSPPPRLAASHAAAAAGKLHVGDCGEGGGPGLACSQTLCILKSFC